MESREDVRLLYLSGSTPRGEECASSDLDVAVAVEPLPSPRDLERLTTELQPPRAECGLRRAEVNAEEEAP